MAKLLVSLISAMGLCLVASVAQADVPEGITVDDGFGFYTIESHSNYGSTPKTASWSLKGRYRVFGHVAPRSLLKMKVMRGRTELVTVTCRVRQHRDDHPQLYTDECYDRSQRSDGDGEIQVKWYLVDGDDDEEHELQTHTIRVRTAPRVDTSQNPDYPEYYIDRHAEVVSTVAYMRPNRYHTYVPLQGRRQQKINGDGIDLVVNASPDWSTANEAIRGSHVRCSVNGERVDLTLAQSQPGMSWNRTDQARVDTGYSSLATWRVTNPSGNPRYNEHKFLFRQFYVRLPLGWGNNPDRVHTPVGEHPGAWECQWRNDQGQTLRVFRFNVDQDGKLVAHSEQGDGLSLGPAAVLIETEVPAGNPLDSRTDGSMPRGGAFHGRGFSTEAGRRMAGAVPNNGTAHPTTARRGRRGRRGRR